MKRWRLASLLILAALFWPALPAAGAAHPTGSTEEAAALLPPGVSPDWWAAAQEGVRQAEYDITWEASTGLANLPAAYQAPNRAQGFRTYFTAGGIWVVPRVGTGWEVRLAPADGAGWEEGWVEGRRYEAASPQAQAWYGNHEAGLEMALRLEEGQAEGCLLRLSTSGLTPRLSADGTVLELLDADGTGMLRYGPFTADDAAGRPLAVHLSLSSSPSLPASSSLLVSLSPRPPVPFSPRLPLPASPGLPITLRAVLVAAEPPAIEGLSAAANWIGESNQPAALYGYSVATAGDVDGDGYSDVIVGAPSYDSGQTDEGAAFLYRGSPSGLATAPDWRAESDQGGEGTVPAQLGCAVGTAGDVNGDGYADIVVGALGYNNGAATWDEGAAFLWLGSAAGLGADGTPANADWTAESDWTSARFGVSVATAGDVNGDGYSDLIVGAPMYDNGQTDEGAAFLWLGSPAGLGTNGTPANADWRAESDQSASFLGYAAATAGDVNGDGYADVIVGAYMYDNGEGNEGAAWVWYGSATGPVGPGTPANADWIAEANLASASLGYAVGTAGDVNGDGYADVIVGAWYYTNGQTNEGAAFVWHGSAGGLPAPGGTPANANWRVESNQGASYMGNAVGTAGDVNGDGYADVIVGARNYNNGLSAEGAAFVWHGSAGGVNGGTPGVPANAAWMASGGQATAIYGMSVGTAGDVNGDGYSEAIVGAYQYDGGESNEGRAYVYHGAPTGLAPAAGWTAERDQASAQLGAAVSGAGDVNGDGYADLVVGARRYDNGQADEGAVFVYHGSANGPSSTPDWSAEGDQDGAEFGVVAGAGDVDNDGYADLVVGAPLYDNGQADEGRASLYRGGAAGLSAVPSWTAEGDQDGAQFGGALAGAGDVDGDGYADVIVGARFYDNGQTDEGRACLYHGAAGGLSAAPGWTAEGDQDSAEFGSGVATAGDVNGDGYADVLVGAQHYGAGQAEEGRAYAYYGSIAGLSPTPNWTAESDQATAYFGYAVGTAGDVDGDGYSDVVVGAPYFDNGELDEGQAYLYRGAAAGLAATPSWTGQGDQADAHYGSAAGTAGDVNGDGYADVVVGAPIYDNGESDEGRASVYHGSASGLGASAAWTAEGNQAGAYFGGAVAAAGDVNGDGYADVVVGAAMLDNGQADEGQALLYYGNGGRGVSLAPRQRRADDSGPIAHEGMSDSASAVRLAALGRIPLGRGRVRLQWEVKPLGTPLDGTGLQQSASWMDTGVAGVALHEWVGSLPAGTAYHWRVRLLYDVVTTPHKPAGRWLTQPWNGWNETQFRTPAQADLAVAKSDTPDPVYALGTLTYTVAVSNAGPNTAAGVRVTDTLPAGVTYLSAAGAGWSCGEAGGVVVCTRAALAVGAAPDVVIVVSAPAEGGLLTNQVSVGSAAADPALADNSDIEETTVAALADLAVAKSDSSDPVYALGTLTYTLAVSNAGPSTAASVRVTDTLPAGVTFVAAAGAGWNCSEGGGEVVCTRATLAVGAAPEIAIVVTAPAEGGLLTNGADVRSAVADLELGDNSDLEETTVLAVADLSIALGDSPDPVGTGELLTYLLTVANAGPSSAAGIVVTDTLPGGVTFDAASGAGWSCSQAGGAVTCSRPALPVGAAPAIAITAYAPLAAGRITDTAEVAGADFDPDPADNAAAAATAVEEHVAGLLAWNDSPTVLGSSTALTATVEAGSNLTCTWDLGDGSPPFAAACPAPLLPAAIAHTYPALGLYTATITASNAVSWMVATTVVTIVAPCAPVTGAAFAWGPAAPVIGEVVAFTGTATGTLPLAYAWTLGDGASGSGANVSHAYGAAGDYLVTLVVTNSCGGAAVTHTVTVDEGCAPVAGADFAWGPAAPLVRQTVAFTGTAAGTPPLSYAWAFGDGTTGSGQSAAHAYAARGRYTVTLTVTNDCGSAAAEEEIVVIGYLRYLPILYRPAPPPLRPIDRPY